MILIQSISLVHPIAIKKRTERQSTLHLNKSVVAVGNSGWSFSASEESAFPITQSILHVHCGLIACQVASSDIACQQLELPQRSIFNYILCSSYTLNSNFEILIQPS